MRNTETNRHEDYMTEVIAPLFSQPEYLRSFLSRFGQKKLETVHDIAVSTQRTYKRILEHQVDSRPDLIVSFTADKQKYLVFFENKLDAVEGSEQLGRYTDHLIEHKNKGYQVLLFYITRRYDPKDYIGTFVPFHQLQWFQFYEWLKNKESNLYIEQVIQYMEDLGLNKIRKFSPAELHVLQSMSKVQGMMDDCLGGIVKREFTSLFGSSRKRTSKSTQFSNDRYVLWNDQSDWKFVGCGFWFMEDDYPQISVFLEGTSKCKNKETLLKAMEEFAADRPEWVFEGPEDENGDFILYMDKSLVQFLTESDHIQAIQDHLGEKLRELHILVLKTPQLVWKVEFLEEEIK